MEGSRGLPTFISLTSTSGFLLLGIFILAERKMSDLLLYFAVLRSNPCPVDFVASDGSTFSTPIMARVKCDMFVSALVPLSLSFSHSLSLI